MSTPVSIGTATLGVESGFTLGFDPSAKTIMTGLDGWYGSTPVRRDSSERTAQHGSHEERGYKEERMITLRGHFQGTDRGEAAREAERLSGFLGEGLDGVLTIDDVDLGTRWCKVYLADNGVDVRWTGGDSFPFTIRMVAPNPRKYGQMVTTGWVTPMVPGGGLVMPLFGPPNTGYLDFGTGGNPGTGSLANIGTARAWPTFRVQANFAGSGFTITDTNSSRRLYYTENIYEGDEVVLNSLTGSVIINGGSHREQFLALSEWTPIEPGATATWFFEAPGATGAKMSVEVIPAWW